ncbi:MAG: aminotransferase class V-fold PLP-dependent enzyme [Coriobacteriia bacterium]|nr:aminotransferase class V-fold PLP-dependent enzyme [Coriobacteriia bacterium]
MLNQELIKKEYGFLGDDIFLNVSQVVMPPKRVQDAYGSFMADYVKNFGEGVMDTAWGIVNDCRQKLASLINAHDPHEIAFVKNTAEGMSILAAGLKLGKGDNVVLADQEHQSALFPWINQHELRGIDLHIVKSVNGEIPFKGMVEAIDDHTKVLIVSSAQFSTGFRADLKRLGAICKERGIIFAVDGIQTLGRFVMDVQECNISWLVAGSNKGLLGTLGCGFIYCDDKLVESVIPPYAGYQSTMSHVAPPSITTEFDYLEWYPHARRFESGNLSYNCILAVNQGVDLLLELGVDNIEKQIRLCEARLRTKIKDLRLPVVQAKDPENWSGIICVYYPKQHDGEVISILRNHKIHCTMRGGYIRFGLNFYNTVEQMDEVAKALFEAAELAK